MQDLFQIGAVTSAHGVHGEVKIFPTTDEPAKFKRMKKMILDTGREQREVEIVSVKFFKNLVICKFKGIDTMNDSEKLKGCTLWITREQSGTLKKDEYYKADLIGLEVFDEDNHFLGELTDVLETGANDVYEILLENGKQLLIPAIKECVLKVDIAEKQMKIHLMEGLLD